jgi:hypothetical protein
MKKAKTTQLLMPGLFLKNKQPKLLILASFKWIAIHYESSHFCRRTGNTYF